jgi:hypothetical protein
MCNGLCTYAPRAAATPCVQGCGAAAYAFRSGPDVIQVHGAQSAVTGKAMDALVSHGISTYVRIMG